MTSDHIWYFLATGTPYGPHGMALNYTDSIKINVEIQIPYLGYQWKSHKSIIFNVICDIENIINFNTQCIWMPKGCAHIASTESTECLEPRNQGGMKFVMNSFAYVQQVSLMLEGTTQKIEL